MELTVKFIKAIISALSFMIKSKSLMTLLIIAIVIELLYPKFRGLMGEFWVKVELKKLPKKDYKVLNNIMIENNNKTYQIDHIVVSKYGVFVIEMKNYYGLIKGNEYDDKWIQYLGKKRYYFNNPLHQNYGHVMALNELLNLDKEVFIPIVCFSNQANLKVTTKSIVVQLDYLTNRIKSFYKEIVNDDIEIIANKINNANITDGNRRNKHVKDIRTKVKEDKIKANNMICPKCGNQLVERNSKYGTFIGCSNYPKCKYIKR